MKYRSIFSGKNKKKYLNMSSAEILPVLCVYLGSVNKSVIVSEYMYLGEIWKSQIVSKRYIYTGMSITTLL